MRFMILGHATPDTEAGVLPSSEEFRKMGEFMEELVKAGVFVAGEGLMAGLARFVRGDLGAAEELAQDALVAALETWPRDGIPREPLRPIVQVK